MIMKMRDLKIGDTVFVDTGINGYLKGVIVYKHETQYNTYNVKLDLGEYGEVIESFSEKRIYKNMKNNQEYFEVAKEYKIPLTGYYNVLVYECQKCDHNMIDELHDNIVGFADSKMGIVKVIECPKCFEKFYCHASESDYWHFLWEIERGKQKHFDKVYK